MRNATPKEGETPKRDAGAPWTWNAIAASLTLPDPRFAGAPVQCFGAPFHSGELQRSPVPRCTIRHSGLTKKMRINGTETHLIMIVLYRQLPIAG
ncbi:hypothetical protein SAMN05216308_10878 [Nitrosospira sp. Nsp13]|jgi:hypothetical protein|nr:hypothetical protein SAMN05216308_10878 [Nitrosospira sp. Nsp13]